jgi:hypothetical protein
MTSSYLERYRNGEHEQVYNELVGLGEAIRTEPLYGEAQAVAQEMMSRAQHNVTLLIERLRSLNYQFLMEQRAQQPTLDPGQLIQNMHATNTPAMPDKFWAALEKFAGNIQPQMKGAIEELVKTLQTPSLKTGSQTSPVWQPHILPTSEFQATIAEIDTQHGPLPLTLRAWCEIVGQVNLMGDHPKLCSYYGKGPASDPLVVEIDESGIEAQLEEREEYPELEETPLILEFAPDSLHKCNTSGGAPNAFELPQRGFDGVIISEDEWDGIYFIPYLRLCFTWGGFPGLRHEVQAAQNAAEELAFLTSGLVPL